MFDKINFDFFYTTQKLIILDTWYFYQKFILAYFSKILKYFDSLETIRRHETCFLVF